MAQGSGAWFTVRRADLEALRKDLETYLQDKGCKIVRNSLSQEKLRLEAHTRHSWKTFLLWLIPYMDLMGYGSRVRTVVRGRTSLKEGDDRYRVEVRCLPLNEYTNEDEEFMLTQSVGERIGDSQQCKRALRKISDFLEKSGYVTR